MLHVSKISALLGATLFCAACVEEAPPTPIEGSATCGAGELQHLIGQDRSVADAMRFSQVTRIIPHNGIVTMDYRHERLNITLDADGVIERVYCG